MLAVALATRLFIGKLPAAEWASHAPQLKSHNSHPFPTPIANMNHKLDLNWSMKCTVECYVGVVTILLAPFIICLYLNYDHLHYPVASNFPII